MTDKQHHLVEHFAELRRRLLYTLGAYGISLCVCFLFINRIFSFLEAPVPGRRLTVLGPGEVMHVYFMVAGVCALIATIPFALWQGWLFVAPALSKELQKVTLRYLPLVLAMFVLGVAFAWYVVFPMLFSFLVKLGSQQFTILYTASGYFGLVAGTVLPLGLFFEMPIVVLFLVRLGIISPRQLIRLRRYAYFVLVVIASMISPPEFVSHLSVAIPLILLYEISILVAKWAARNRLLVDRA
ncbi:twin-arginine translocase subunit TatC [Effusibacillus pohliae]|uniref:twin-arginine translocase subunit TatC n=1 Tax=Effusibacillus pohliae TaxID=232270 RepID=UPI0003797DA5|nr:twin-arginine translocase subunit TatC [Effusibacillus pohliae]